MALIKKIKKIRGQAAAFFNGNENVLRKTPEALPWWDFRRLFFRGPWRLGKKNLFVSRSSFSTSIPSYAKPLDEIYNGKKDL